MLIGLIVREPDPIITTASVVDAISIGIYVMLAIFTIELATPKIRTASVAY